MSKPLNYRRVQWSAGSHPKHDKTQISCCTHYTVFWLLVYLPLWKIWIRQLGIIIPTEWKNKIHVQCSKPPTSFCWFISYFSCFVPIRNPHSRYFKVHPSLVVAQLSVLHVDGWRLGWSCGLVHGLESRVNIQKDAEHIGVSPWFPVGTWATYPFANQPWLGNPKMKILLEKSSMEDYPFPCLKPEATWGQRSPWLKSTISTIWM